MRRARLLGLGVVDGAAVLVTASGIPSACRLLTAGVPSSIDATAAALCMALLQLAAVWLAVGLLAQAAAALPGATGRLAARAAARLLPRLVQRLLAGAVGVGIVAAPVAASAMAPTPGSSPPSSTALPAPGWPTDDPLPPPRWPTNSPRSHAPTSQPGSGRGPGAHQRSARRPTSHRSTQPPASHSDQVRVRPGNSLWEIAARTLPGRPTPARIAAAWPCWWAANRSVIGPNPNLLHPGQLLTAPRGGPKEPGG
jgi:nucleoid-associated protein YgaU